LGGNATLPPLPEVEVAKLNPPASTASQDKIHAGEQKFQRYCSGCHGDVAVSGGVLPDLRYSSTLGNEQFFQIVLGGMLQQNGMVSFARELNRQDVTNIRDYVIYRANQSKREQQAETAAAK
jgi:mono/diheme cytochrome c family protein